jgi:ABC-type branched-subunit amino acid transport system substrate-binding protein
MEAVFSSCHHFLPTKKGGSNETHHNPILAVLLLVLSLLLSAVRPTPGSGSQVKRRSRRPAPAEVKETTAIIGFTASQTGSLNVESIRQINGLNLWMKHVNEAGGVQLADGSKVKFESRFYDDESNKDRVQELYTRLATEDNATFMISPYSSGLADASAVIAEQYGKNPDYNRCSL